MKKLLNHFFNHIYSPLVSAQYFQRSKDFTRQEYASGSNNNGKNLGGIYLYQLAVQVDLEDSNKFPGSKSMQYGWIPLRINILQIWSSPLCFIEKVRQNRKELASIWERW